MVGNTANLLKALVSPSRPVSQDASHHGSSPLSSPNLTPSRRTRRRASEDDEDTSSPSRGKRQRVSFRTPPPQLCTPTRGKRASKTSIPGMSDLTDSSDTDDDKRPSPFLRTPRSSPGIDGATIRLPSPIMHRLYRIGQEDLAERYVQEQEDLFRIARDKFVETQGKLGAVPTLEVEVDDGLETPVRPVNVNVNVNVDWEMDDSYPVEAGTKSRETTATHNDQEVHEEAEQPDINITPGDSVVPGTLSFRPRRPPISTPVTPTNRLTGVELVDPPSTPPPALRRPRISTPSSVRYRQAKLASQSLSTSFDGSPAPSLAHSSPSTTPSRLGGQSESQLSSQNTLLLTPRTLPPTPSQRTGGKADSAPEHGGSERDPFSYTRTERQLEGVNELHPLGTPPSSLRERSRPRAPLPFVTSGEEELDDDDDSLSGDHDDHSHASHGHAHGRVIDDDILLDHTSLSGPIPCGDRLERPAPDPSLPPLGMGISTAGGKHKAADRLYHLCRQYPSIRGASFMLNSPRRRVGEKVGKARIKEQLEYAHFRNRIDQLGEDVRVNLLAHAVYTANLASSDRKLRKRSFKSLQTELRQCVSLGIPTLVFHLGSDHTRPANVVRREAAKYLRRLLDSVPGSILAIENMTHRCHGETSATLHNIRHIIKRVKRPGRLKVCLDLCHVYVQEYDFFKPKALGKFFRAIDKLGPDNVAAIHISDSYVPHGDTGDRHANIGFGLIPLAAFRAILRDRRFRSVPFLLETPAYFPRNSDIGYGLPHQIGKIELERLFGELDYLLSIARMDDPEWEEEQKTEERSQDWRKWKSRLENRIYRLFMDGDIVLGEKFRAARKRIIRAIHTASIIRWYREGRQPTATPKKKKLFGTPTPGTGAYVTRSTPCRLGEKSWDDQSWDGLSSDAE